MICKKLRKARRLLHLRVLRYATDHAVLPAGMDKNSKKVEKEERKCPYCGRIIPLDVRACICQ